jgi:tetratricopeptide (TPR) repeat protein
MNTSERPQFQQAIRYYKQGDRETAQRFLRQVLLEDPTFVPAWLWMSAVVDDLAQQRDCLERALAIDPQCEPAIRGLRILRLRETAQTLPTEEPVSVAVPTPHEEEISRRQAGRLGEYLVEQGLITQKQLEMALEEQRLFWKKTQGVRAPLGNILINNGMLTPQMLATALVSQQRDKLQGKQRQSPQYVGEYLVARGIITPQQLENVLAEQMRLRQKGTSILIGELLIHAGYVTRQLLEEVLEEQRNELFSRFGFED